MLKIVASISLLAVIIQAKPSGLVPASSPFLAPAPVLGPAPVIAPVVLPPPPIVTARSAQYYARNYNGLVQVPIAPAVAPVVPRAFAPPLVPAVAPSPIFAPTPYVAGPRVFPGVAPAPVIGPSPYLASHYVSAPGPVIGPSPYVAAPFVAPGPLLHSAPHYHRYAPFLPGTNAVVAV